MNILETERLILRTWNEKDSAPMTAINQDPKVCKYLPSIGNRSTTEAMIQRFIKHFKEHQFSLYAV
jgi:RimJ/RimL family protein N-acetyltransferase